MESAEPATPPATSVSASKRPLPRATVILGAIVAVALFEAGAAVYHHLEVPSRGDYQAAADAVRAGFQPGDLVVFAPEWLDPVGRMYLGDLLPMPVAGRMDSDRYARVWELSIAGHESPECQTEGSQVSDDAWHGKVRVRLCARQAPTVLYDFVAREPSDAQVESAHDGRPPVSCPQMGDRATCPGGDPSTNYVGPLLTEVDYGPKYCVWAHPIDGGEMHVTYPAVPLGGRLVGWAGIADFESRHMYDKAAGVYHNPPADLSVSIDGQPVASLRSDSDSGWSRFEVDTSSWAGGTHAVRFTTRAPEGANLRQLCFAAEARDR
jgi:hypothetical protein